MNGRTPKKLIENSTPTAAIAIKGTPTFLFLSKTPPTIPRTENKSPAKPRPIALPPLPGVTDSLKPPTRSAIIPPIIPKKTSYYPYPKSFAHLHNLPSEKTNNNVQRDDKGFAICCCQTFNLKLYLVMKYYNLIQKHIKSRKALFWKRTSIKGKILLKKMKNDKTICYIRSL
jgi:hypothetical protein